MANQTGFFLILIPHLGAYMIGLTNPNGQSDRFFFLIFTPHLGAYITGLTNPNGQSDSFFLILTPHLGAYLTGLTNPNGQSNSFFFNLHHLVLCSAASLVVLNFVTHVYLPELTLDCSPSIFIFTHLDLPSTTSSSIFISRSLVWTYL